MWWFASLLLFSKFSLSFERLIIVHFTMCLSKGGDCWASWMFIFMSFIQFGKFSAAIFSNMILPTVFLGLQQCISLLIVLSTQIHFEFLYVNFISVIVLSAPELLIGFFLCVLSADINILFTHCFLAFFHSLSIFKVVSPLKKNFFIRYAAAAKLLQSCLTP